MQGKKLLLPTALWPLIGWLLFAGVYAGQFALKRVAYAEWYDYSVSRIPSVMLYGSDTALQLKEYAASYAVFLGFGLGLIFALLAYFLLGLFALVRLSRLRIHVPLALLLAVLPLDAIAYVIRAQDRPTTAIAAALVNFVGGPFWTASLVTTGIFIALLLFSIIYGKAPEKTQ